MSSQVRQINPTCFLLFLFVAVLGLDRRTASKVRGFAASAQVLYIRFQLLVKHVDDARVNKVEIGQESGDWASSG